MNPLYLGAIARWLITIAATKGITLTEDSALQILSGAIAVGSLLWSLRQKKQTTDDKAMGW
ncbi:MAG: hypothetical protein ACKVQA_07040 [Burkholderiales bacterium]